MKNCHFLLLLFCSLIFWSSCHRESDLDSRALLTPVPQAIPGDDHLPYEEPCTGTFPFSAGYTVLNPNLYPGFDLAIRVVPGTIPPLGNDCECRTIMYCLNLSFNKADLSEAAIFIPSSPEYGILPLQDDDIDGYFDPCTHAPLNENPSAIPTSNTQILSQTSTSITLSICISNPKSSILLFNFNNGFPPGISSLNSVNSVTGICIVDNIPDPHGGS